MGCEVVRNNVKKRHGSYLPLLLKKVSGERKTGRQIFLRPRVLRTINEHKCRRYFARDGVWFHDEVVL